MGDILGAVLGSGQRTSQDVKVDPTTQALNEAKLNQALGLFDAAGLGSFIGSKESAYAPSPEVASLYRAARAGMEPSNVDTSSLLSFGDYSNLGLDRSLLDESIGSGRTNAQTAFQNAEGTYGRASGINQSNLGAATSQFNDLARNYIAQIATPQIQQQMALQGMEGSGAVNSAISKATADVGLQYLMPLISQFNAAQQQLGQQNMANESNIFTNFANNEAQAYGSYIPTEKSFISSLPGASTGLFMAPQQAQTLAAQRSIYPAQAASTLFPLADYSRGLQESNLLRQQGLATTAFTGLPYTPETSTKQRTSSQPLFNFFGQG